uniref:Uncharacterized protein n=1 Tax=viral metagenome TaxID=1070528 RepID=A0A6C0ANE2_9ZZZZ
MYQTYTPSSILSIGFGETLEQVIVLTDNKVATKTFAGKPVTRRDIMSLDDWTIMAKSLGEQIQTDYLPLPPNPLLPRNLARPASTYAAPESGRGYLMDLNYSAQSGSSSAILELSTLLQKYGVSSVEEALAITEVPVAAPTSVEPESYPIGTKLSWKHNGDSSRWYNPNSRTAIVVKDGILQVKENIDGVTTMTQAPGADYQKVARKFFSSLADWKATLPAGGTTTVAVATEDFSLPSIQRKAAKPIVTETDIDYIDELKRRYEVHSKLQEGLTPVEQRCDLIIQMSEMANHIKEIMQSSTLTSVNTTPSGAVSDAMRKLSYISKRLARRAYTMENCHSRIRIMPETANVKPISFINNYRQRIMAFVGGREVEITSNKKLGLLGVAWDRQQDAIGKWFKPTVEKTFAQLGVDLKADGYPRLKVYYRCKSIEL